MSIPKFKTSLRLGLIIALVAGALAFMPHPAHAASIVVNSISDDQTAGTGACVQAGITCLREAITTADATSGEMITFSVTGTILLTIGTFPPITSSMTISGPGAAQLAIDGLNTYQIRDCKM